MVVPRGNVPLSGSSRRLFEVFELILDFGKFECTRMQKEIRVGVKFFSEEAALNAVDLLLEREQPGGNFDA